MEPPHLDLDALAAAVVRTGRGRPRLLVGIDGPGASGKSTLAGLLAERIDSAEVVHVDDFYLPSAIRDSRAGEVGALFDLPRLADQVVLPAAAGGPLRYQRYDWDRDRLEEWWEIGAGVPVIVEGVFSLHQGLRGHYTYGVFCRADRTVRLRRGLDRDGEQARSMWEDQWMPAEDRYAAAQRPDDLADLVVDSSSAAGDAGVRFTVARWRDG